MDIGAALVSYAVVAMPTGVLADRFGAGRVGVVGLIGCALVLPLITMVDDDDHARVCALYNTAYGIGMVAGPVAGSALVDGVGHAHALQLVAGACAVAALSARR